jgi:hypothetical protein
VLELLKNYFMEKSYQEKIEELEKQIKEKEAKGETSSGGFLQLIILIGSIILVIYSLYVLITI